MTRLKEKGRVVGIHGDFEVGPVGLQKRFDDLVEAVEVAAAVLRNDRIKVRVISALDILEEALKDAEA